MLLSVIETAETLGCSAQYVRKLLREAFRAQDDVPLHAFDHRSGSAALIVIGLIVYIVLNKRIVD